MGKASVKKRGDRPSKSQLKALARRRQQRQMLGYALGGIAVVALAGTLLFTGGGGGEGKASDPNQVEIVGQPRGALQQGETVPEFSAPGLRGGRVSWSDYAGKPTVLVIWAPWCPHCQVELPLLGKIAPDYPGVQIVTVATAIGDQPGPDPVQLMTDSDLDAPTAVDDGDETLMQGLGVEGFPTSYYVKADGTVMLMTSGETPEDQLRGLFEQVQQP